MTTLGHLAKRHASLASDRQNAARLGARDMALAVSSWFEGDTFALALELANGVAATLTSNEGAEDAPTAVEVARAAIEHRRSHALTYGWPLTWPRAEDVEVMARLMAGAWAAAAAEETTKGAL